MNYGLSLAERKARLLEAACCGSGGGGDMEFDTNESGGDTMDYGSRLDKTLKTLDMLKKRKKGKKNGS